MAGRRPPHVRAPSHLAESPPVPEPAAPVDRKEKGGPKGKEPTRYGDWERKGICCDF